MSTPRRNQRIANLSGCTFTNALLALLMLLAGALASAQTPDLDVPFVPTPQVVVDRMLEIAKVGKDDVVYDLGSGDGRIVITAAAKHGAQGVGIDIDPERIKDARKNAINAGVGRQVKFIAGDLFKADLSDASVVTLYLLGSVNRDLRPQLWRQLKVGTRVVSHAFDMGPDWPAEKTEAVDGRNIYYWTITEANKRAARASETAARAGP
ncbi:class I SAM-dependent methyltransferase [Massilia glaciei]|uniref:Class I SAM-dependent methyltransferase n=1 Tax=Massilia glaciei TaxID=1524097 RepID=A0A2U2HIA3_9BURK|nr:methyltransferase domain-containing protein [Massilia glaciei]PWF46080.1 class I SAM-dependent methyltransferase [Massilia glaciei]